MVALRTEFDMRWRGTIGSHVMLLEHSTRLYCSSVHDPNKTDKTKYEQEHTKNPKFMHHNTLEQHKPEVVSW
jgi:hypothetical protein